MAYADKKIEEKDYEKRFVGFDQVLTNNELIYLDKEIRDHFYENGMFNEKKLLIAKGALNEKGEIIISGFQHIPHPNPKEKGEMIADCYPIKYQEWSSKIEQWKRWVDKANYFNGTKQKYIDESIKKASSNFQLK